MIITIVISMLIAMCSQTFFVLCAKTKQNKKNNILPVTPQANTPLPMDRRPLVIEREDRDSTRTKAGNRNQSSKEPDSADDAFKDLAARLAKKEKPDKTNDSLLADDENPLAQFQMPERPVVEPNQDGAKLENIVEMKKKPTSKPTTKAATPMNAPITAKDASIAKPLPNSGGSVVAVKSKMSVKTSVKIKKSNIESTAIVTDKTQSDPRENKELVPEKTQQGTIEEQDLGGGKKEKKTEKESIKKNLSMSTKKSKIDKSTRDKKKQGET